MSDNRVLIVDDDPRICSYLSRVARTEGFDTFAIDNPTLFADSYFGFDPSLIMLDLQMGKSDGIEILRFLASQQAKTPIVLMSGVDKNVIESASLFAKSMQLKIDNACSKPLESEQLSGIFNRNYKQPSDRTFRHQINKQEILRAMDNHAMCVYFQPVHSLTQKQTCALELLARWRSDYNQLLLPARFIESVENYGLLETFTFYILDSGVMSCEPLIKRQDGVCISANVSVNILKNVEFPDRLCKLLRKFDLPPERIILEVQNFSYLKNISSVLDILSRLRLKGFRLAIDDFSSNSIALIKQYKLPFTEVKFSRNLLTAACLEDDKLSDLQKLIESVNKLGLQPCLKGVDSKEKFELSQQLGVEMIQGYYICKPLAASAVSVWM